MNPSNILAHRGYWHNEKEQNSKNSFTNALDLGFGIETDIRDHIGKLVISHDPPNNDFELNLEEFFELIISSCTSGRIALNIKSDGLANSIKTICEKNLQLKNRVFVFDMSIPDTLQYLKNKIATYGRLSEFEKQIVFLDSINGVWVDNFIGEFDQVAECIKLIKKGFRTSLVSPELHGREYIKTWELIKISEIHKNPKFELCTDFPEDALNFFNR